VYSLMVNPARLVPEDLAAALEWTLVEPFPAGVVRYLKFRRVNGITEKVLLYQLVDLMVFFY
jgi:hypothetical protein